MPNIPAAVHSYYKMLPYRFDGDIPPIINSIEEMQIFNINTNPENEGFFYSVYGKIGATEYSRVRILWHKVLALALEDYVTSYQADKNQFREVFNWFFNEPNSNPGSFFFVCEILNIHPRMVLNPLINWTKKQNQRLY